MKRPRRFKLWPIFTICLLSVLLVLLVACRMLDAPDPAPPAVLIPTAAHTQMPRVTREEVKVTPAPTPTPTPTPEPTPEPVEEPPAPSYLYLPEVPLDADLQEVMQVACEEYGVPFALALAVAEVESTFKLDADNGLCYGLMQINSCNFSWLADLGIDAHTNEGNIQAGVLILGGHLADYGGDWHKALMAYNCGPVTARRLWGEGYTSTSYSRTVVEGADKWQSVIDKDQNDN